MQPLVKSVSTTQALNSSVFVGSYQLSSIVLWVSDMDTQSRFYAELFNVANVETRNGFAQVGDGANSVLLHQLPLEYRAQTPLNEALTAQTEVAIKPIFRVSSIQETTERIQHSFAKISGEVLNHGEFNYLDVIDPEGNVIQICEQVH